MLSATRKLAMTHRSISSLDFGSVAVWGEGLAWPCPPTWSNPGAMTSPRRLANMGPWDAALHSFLQVACSSCVLEQTRFHGSIGTRWGRAAPGGNHAPSRLVLVGKEFFSLLRSNDAGGVRQSSIRLLPPRARDQGATCCNRLASNACCHPRTRHRVERPCFTTGQDIIMRR